jgi:hypothetical protein
MPIAKRRPPVDRLITFGVVPNSAAISLLALRREVEEKHAPSVVQEVTKTSIDLRQRGRVSYSAEALVSTFSRSLFARCVTTCGTILGCDEFCGFDLAP